MKQLAAPSMALLALLMLLVPIARDGIAAVVNGRQMLLGRLADEAKRQNPGFAGFSAERGRSFYLAKHAEGGNTPSCASCHGASPRSEGRTPAGRSIDPMAVSLSPQRFNNPVRVERWFSRECDQVLGRACTATEKGDFITFMSSQ